MFLFRKKDKSSKEGGAPADAVGEQPGTADASDAAVARVTEASVAVEARTEAGAVAGAEAAALSEDEERRGFFARVAGSLGKTRSRVFGALGAVLSGRGRIDADMLDAIEDALLEADIGTEVADLIVGKLRAAWKAKEIETADQVVPHLKRDLGATLSASGNDLRLASDGCTVVLICGVNGTGKTTSIGKLAWRCKFEGLKVLVAAGDTFRAAAENQLRVWAEERVGVDFVQAAAGVTDPGAVAHIAAERARDGGYDVLLFDTAGRLHTQKNLMEQLAKIKRVLGKQIPGAPHEVLLVLDATTGQNALTQARIFKDAAGVTGLFLAKLDSSAKGGVVLAIHESVEVPVKFVGTGEQMKDIAPFVASDFVDALFDGLEGDA